MQAIVRAKAGKEFSTMSVCDLKSPSVQRGEVKVLVASSRINKVDMDLMKGFPGLKYKSPQPGGVDGAGTIIEVGAQVSGFAVGDEVFFYRLFTDIGTWAEEITVPANHVARIPNSMTVQDAGAIALPLLTAYEGLMALSPKAGDSILIHGAGGGVGFQVTQLAKQMGLHIYANASERDRADLEKVGVARFIDYRSKDFYEELKDNPPTYVFDVLGKETLKKSILLKPEAVVSTVLPDANAMHKTGVKLTGFLKFVIQFMTRKFNKLGQKQGVKVVGLVTGANGEHLRQTVALANARQEYLVRPYKRISMKDISSRGLNAKDVGKVIVFKPEQTDA